MSNAERAVATSDRSSAAIGITTLTDGRRCEDVERFGVDVDVSRRTVTKAVAKWTPKAIARIAASSAVSVKTTSIQAIYHSRDDTSCLDESARVTTHETSSHSDPSHVA